MSRPVIIAGAAKLGLIAFGIAFMIAALLPDNRVEQRPVVHAAELADVGSSGSGDVSLRSSAPVPATAALEELRPRRSASSAATQAPAPAATSTPIPVVTATPTATASATPAPSPVPAPAQGAPARPVPPAPTPVAPVGGRFDDSGAGSGEFDLSDGTP